MNKDFEQQRRLAGIALSSSTIKLAWMEMPCVGRLFGCLLTPVGFLSHFLQLAFSWLVVLDLYLEVLLSETAVQCMALSF